MPHFGIWISVLDPLPSRLTNHGYVSHEADKDFAFPDGLQSLRQDRGAYARVIVGDYFDHRGIRCLDPNSSENPGRAGAFITPYEASSV